MARDRVETLRRAELLATLEETELRAVAEIADACRHGPGDVIVAEGKPGAAYYVIAEGAVRVTQRGDDGASLVVRQLGTGDGFGEVALVSSDHRRTATVTALEDVLTLRIPAEALRTLWAAHPELDRRLRAGVERCLVEGILVRSEEFGVLRPRQREWLASRIGVETPEAGELLIREGEPGDRCYVIAEGTVVVLRRGPDGSDRRVTTLGAGALFGESALLTDAPRSASVRTLEPARLLTLDRTVLREALGDQRLGRRVLQVLRIRAWPRQAAGVEIFERVNPEGERVTILRDAAHGVYHRLSPEGRFLWDRLDGDHSLRDLTLAFLHEHGVFAPQEISRTLQRLIQRGFVEAASLRGDVRSALDPRRRGLLAWARAVACWSWSCAGWSPWVTRLYRWGGRLLFTPVALVLMTVLVVAGVAASVHRGIEFGTGWHGETLSPALWLAFLPVFLVSVLVHEAAHALAVRHYGREVDRIGFGLYYLMPICFVDTSDMWLSERRPRIAVSLAGLGASALVGSLAALAAAHGGLPTPISVLLWQLAVVSFATVVVNLNPLLELDGYYVLVDLLDRPNLRRDALRWLGRRLGARPADPPREQADPVLVGYALGAVLYLIFLSAFVLLTHRLLLEGWLAAVLSTNASTLVAWGLVALAVGANLLALVGEVRGTEQA